MSGWVIVVVLAVALTAMILLVAWAGSREVRSRERAEREGALGPAGRQRARERARIQPPPEG